MKFFSLEKSKLKKKFRNPHQIQLQSPFSKRKFYMITQLGTLNNQKRSKNASKMIKFPCDISPCNIRSVSHAIWVAAILRYTISRSISVWVSIVFYMPYYKAIFFCNITYRMLRRCKIPLSIWYWVALLAMSYFTIPGVISSIPSGVDEIINFF